MKDIREPIIKLQQNDNYRIIAISDIHAHAGHFQEMLNRLHLQTDDILIIIGDFINRGPESLKTYKLIKEIQKRPHTYILKGNHESFIYGSLMDESRTDPFLRFIQQNYYPTLVHEMASETNFDLASCSSGKALRDHMLTHFLPLLEDLNNLPIIVENDDFIFVHGGYDPELDPAKDQTSFLKYDNYNELSSVNHKQVVVGHWPASNLRTNQFSNLPMFNTEKKIITIDGGLGVKSSGELNALIIEKHDGQIAYGHLQVNNFSRSKIQAAHHFHNEEPIYVSFPHFEVDILERKNDFVLCKHQHTQKPLSVFPSLLEDTEDGYRIKTTYINKFFNLPVGEEVEVCLAFEDCILVKHNEEFGWVARNQIKKPVS